MLRLSPPLPPLPVVLLLKVVELLLKVVRLRLLLKVKLLLKVVLKPLQKLRLRVEKLHLKVVLNLSSNYLEPFYQIL
jgi:hypothetical protein